MDEQTTMSDDRVLQLLGEAAADADPVPDHVREAARAAFAWRTIDADLAQLVEDTAEAPTAGVRAIAGPRLLTFEAAGTTVVLEVSVTGAGRRVLGQVLAPRAATIEVRHAGDTVTVEADALGRFTVEHVSPGPMSLRCDFRDPAETVVTSWVTV